MCERRDRGIGLGSFIKGEEYQASPNVVARDLPKNMGSCQQARLDYPYRSKGDTISPLTGHAKETTSWCVR